MLPPDCPKCGGRRHMAAVLPAPSREPGVPTFDVVEGTALCPRCDPPFPFAQKMAEMRAGLEVRGEG